MTSDSLCLLSLDLCNSPHSGDRSEGKYREKIGGRNKKKSAIWDLGGIGIVENLRTGSANISSYRQVHSENFYFLTKSVCLGEK